MQKYLWRSLKDLSVFSLIGTPVTEEIVNNQLKRLGLDEEFVSGDYKASTDNLHSWVSECLLDELVSIWKETVSLQNPEEQDEFGGHIDQYETLMKRALTGHSILDPIYNEVYRRDDSLKEEWFKPQKEGQLMGSIISFPFLCLANAALCRFSMEITDTKNYKLVDRYIESYENARLLINGDDCVFPGKVELMFSNWKKITGFGGLESSVGKTFRSRKFLTINSCQYSYVESRHNWEDDVDQEVPEFSYTLIKYVNMGLIYAQTKSGKRGKPYYRLGSIHRDLADTCPDEMFARASRRFRKEASKPKYHKIMDPKTKSWKRGPDGKQIKVETSFSRMTDAQVPYHLPEWLGGLGLVPDKELLGNLRTSEHTSFDLEAAAFIRKNMQSGCIRPKSYKNNPMWQFHRIVDKQLEDFLFLANQTYRLISFDETTRTMKEEYQKLYSLTVVDILLHTPVFKLVEGTDKKEEDEQLQAVHFHNSRLWKRVRHMAKRSLNEVSGDLSALEMRELQDLSYEDFLQEKKEFSLACFDVRR
jgi:hypothetical protein